MIKNYNSFKNKKASNGNFKPKKEKNKLSFYLVIGAIIFCVLGSILGSWAFVENRVANAEINPLFIEYDFDTLELPFGTPVNIPSGVTTVVDNNPDFKNVGWKNFVRGLNTLSLYRSKFNSTDSNGDRYEVDKQYIKYSTYQPLSITENYINAFFSLSESSNISSVKTYVVKLNLALPLLDSQKFTDSNILDFVEYFNFYFFNAPMSYDMKNDIYLAYSNMSADERKFNLAIEDPDFYYYFTDIEFLYYPGTTDLDFSSFRLDLKFGDSVPNFDFFNMYKLMCINSISITDIAGNEYYESGYNSGLTIGRQEGREEAEEIYKDQIQELQNRLDNFQDEIDSAFNRGKLEGYNQGVASAGEITFFNLISSTIDVPINAVKSLFNFEVFGQNLTNFILALITFALVIKIISLLL